MSALGCVAAFVVSSAVLAYLVARFSSPPTSLGPIFASLRADGRIRCARAEYLHGRRAKHCAHAHGRARRKVLIRRLQRALSYAAAFRPSTFQHVV